MDPGIQYARTSDGADIAYWATGAGPGFVYLPNLPYSHCELEWKFPPSREIYERLARHYRVVRYDGRGTGLSDRTKLAQSMDAYLADLDAVIAHAQLDSCVLLGSYHTGTVAIAYAAAHPDSVRQLILWCGYERGEQYVESPQVVATRELIDKDWNLYTETNAHLVMGWSHGRRAQIFAAFMRESVTPEAVKSAYATFSGIDVSHLLADVRAPTLVLHRRELPWLDVAVPRGLAARIPNAQLVMLEGDAGTLYTDIDESIGAIERFLGVAPPPRALDATAAAALRTILFTDVESNTALLQRLGDDKWRALLRDHERITRSVLARHGGTEVKAMGDGFMASFVSATGAIECAIALQRAFTDETDLKVRIGLNAGEPIAEDHDLFGTAVTTAARITAQAAGGEIFVSDVVRQLVAGKGFEFADRGEAALYGFDDPVRLYEVRLPSGE